MKWSLSSWGGLIEKAIEEVSVYEGERHGSGIGRFRLAAECCAAAP